MTIQNIQDIPIVKQAKFLLEAIDEEGTKLTERGFLPRKITVQFWEEFLKDEKFAM